MRFDHARWLAEAQAMIEELEGLLNLRLGKGSPESFALQGIAVYEVRLYCQKQSELSVLYLMMGRSCSTLR